MLRALLLDQAHALVHEGRVLPHVPAALEALSSLHGPQGDVLRLFLVCDRLLEECVDEVRSLGLLRFFEPAADPFILSTHAGPSDEWCRQAAEVALRRLGHRDLELAAAGLVSNRGERVASARQLGMYALQIGGDCEDWSSVPLRIARAMGIVAPGALLGPLNVRLEALYGVRLARVGHAAGAELSGELDGSDAAPVAVILDGQGDVARLEHRGELAHSERLFRKMLRDTGQIAAAGEPLSPGQTHEEQAGPDGTPRPRRKRFSLV